MTNTERADRLNMKLEIWYGGANAQSQVLDRCQGRDRIDNIFQKTGEIDPERMLDLAWDMIRELSNQETDLRKMRLSFMLEITRQFLEKSFRTESQRVIAAS